jgi:hypothetical protein
MVSDLSNLAARHAAEIEEITGHEPGHARESTAGVVLMMTVRRLQAKGIPAVGITYVPVSAK